MKNHKYFNAFAIITFLALSIGSDQVSKKMVREKLALGERIDIVNDHFILTRVENEGAFLSLGSDLHPVLNMVILKIFPTLVLLALLIWLFIKKSFVLIQLIGFTLIVGGGIANIFDRFIFEAVTDFLFIELGFFRTGVFNIADVFIMIGTGMVLLSTFKNKKKKEVSYT